jgi:hypothetical protein
MAKHMVNHSAGFRQSSLHVGFCFHATSHQNVGNDHQQPRADCVIYTLRESDLAYQNQSLISIVLFMCNAARLIVKKATSCAESNTDRVFMTAGFSLSMLWFKGHRLSLMPSRSFARAGLSGGHLFLIKLDQGGSNVATRCRGNSFCQTTARYN